MLNSREIGLKPTYCGFNLRTISEGLRLQIDIWATDWNYKFRNTNRDYSYRLRLGLQIGIWATY